MAHATGAVTAIRDSMHGLRSSPLGRTEIVGTRILMDSIDLAGEKKEEWKVCVNRWERDSGPDDPAGRINLTYTLV